MPIKERKGFKCAGMWTKDGSCVQSRVEGRHARITRADQVVANAGLDIQVRQSGKWKGEAKLSKRGSGRLRRLLYLTAVRSIRLQDSAFGQYYHHLVARGMKKVEALMAVMRKKLLVAYRLLRTEETFDPGKVCVAALPHTPSPGQLTTTGVDTFYGFFW